MTWTEPEVQIAEAPLVRFAFGSLTEETDYDYEVSLDPTFSEGVFGGQFRTTAVQNDVRLAGVMIGSTALDLSGFDLSVQTDLPVTASIVAGTQTITATAEAAGATVTVDPTTVMVDSDGFVAITATVTNQTSSRTYNLYVDITVINAVDITLAATNGNIIDVTGVGALLYTADASAGGTAFAYVRETGARATTSDVTLANAAQAKRAIASSDHRLYVVQLTRAVLVYDHSGNRITTEEFTLHASNAAPNGAVVHDGHLYVVNNNHTSSKVFAYDMTSGARVTGREWNLDTGGFTHNNNNPTGIWTNGTHWWIVDSTLRQAVAYDNSANRVNGQDFTTLDAAGNDAPRGMWSDGAVVWIGDTADDEVYVYSLNSKARLA